MFFKSIVTVATLSLFVHVNGQEIHGQSAKGTTMGAVAFMWPADRPWSASHDNVGPCGSTEGPSNRTNFPLGAAGAVSFSIADESTNIALRIAYGNNPSRQGEFTQFHSTISNFEPGHQCRSVPASPSNVVVGTNATLQLEYWAEDSAKEGSYFACADVTFVDAMVFDTRIPCFNVTTDEFTPAGATPTTTVVPSSTAASDSSASSAAAPTQASSANGGLSTAEKAGIAVATIFGALLVASVVFFMIRRKRSPVKDSESTPGMTKVASHHSGDAASRN